MDIRGWNAAKEIADMVLNDAANTEGYFELSDAERLIWMMWRAAVYGAALAYADQPGLKRIRDALSTRGTRAALRRASRQAPSKRSPRKSHS